MKIVDINGNKRECVKILQDVDWPGYLQAELIGSQEPMLSGIRLRNLLKITPFAHSVNFLLPKRNMMTSAIIRISVDPMLNIVS